MNNMNLYNPIQQMVESQKRNLYGSLFGMPAMMNQMIECIPVSNINEVKSYICDMMGKISVFIDPSNNRFFTKQIGLDGKSQISVYTESEMPQDEYSNNSGISGNEKQEMMEYIQKLEREINWLKEQKHETRDNANFENR